MPPCKNSPLDDTVDFQDFLATLQEASQPLHPHDLSELMARLSLARDDLAAWTKFDSKAYARNRVALFPQVEVLVMCWKSGQLTPVHNHKGSSCCVRVVQGIATEICYQKSKCGALVPISHARSFQGDVLSSYDLDTHQIGNLEAPGTDLISLHCYSPALTKMKLYDTREVYFDGYERLIASVAERLAVRAVPNLSLAESL